MFTYFHQHKFRYEKGQIAPLMILVLVIILIMSLVTVNLYKVAMDKTYSANGVDAGALAAGSVMANLFNSLASANAEMKKGYVLAYISMGVSVAIIEAYLISAGVGIGTALGVVGAAMGEAYPAPGAAAVTIGGAAVPTTAAIASLGTAQTAIYGLMVGVSALYAAQLYFYGKLRNNAIKGRQNAMEMGHKFTFYNSSIGSRLPDNKPVGSSWSKSRKDFSRFIDDISVKKHGSVADSYKFEWVDGQYRQHSAESKVATQDLDTFDLIVTIAPFLAEMAMLAGCAMMNGSAIGMLTSLILPVVGLYTSAAIVLVAAQIAMVCCWTVLGAPVCCPAWAKLSSAAIAILGACEGILGGALDLVWGTGILAGVFLAGLAPREGARVRDDHMGFEISNSIICWIDDIVHDRRFSTDFVLTQQGADLGLMQTDYPSVHSFSEVDFTGGGKILPGSSEDLSFDPSIIKTDNIGKME